jgi:GDP-L-fucose synthase
MLNTNSKIYIAGHHGLVGSAIWTNLKARGYHNLVGRSHRELDLTNQAAVKAFFDQEQPDAVVLAAAFVGGIMANSLYVPTSSCRTEDAVQRHEQATSTPWV